MRQKEGWASPVSLRKFQDSDFYSGILDDTWRDHAKHHVSPCDAVCHHGARMLRLKELNKLSESTQELRCPWSLDWFSTNLGDCVKMNTWKTLTVLRCGDNCHGYSGNFLARTWQRPCLLREPTLCFCCSIIFKHYFFLQVTTDDSSRDSDTFTVYEHVLARTDLISSSTKSKFILPLMSNGKNLVLWGRPVFRWKLTWIKPHKWDTQWHTILNLHLFCPSLAQMQILWLLFKREPGELKSWCQMLLE